jgi:hypothetical protein
MVRILDDFWDYHHKEAFFVENFELHELIDVLQLAHAEKSNYLQVLNRISHLIEVCNNLILKLAPTKNVLDKSA